MAVELVAKFARAFVGGPTIDVDLALDASHMPVVVLFGPSGSGKTSILRALAGLDRPDRGRITWSGAPWFDHAAAIDVPPQRRRVGYVSQQASLFPHMTVRSNIEFGVAALRKSPPGGAARDAAVSALIDQYDLGALHDRYPNQLSGGQKQRVALARALARSPSILLLDEPLSALDANARETMRDQLRRWLRTSGTPAILVTHDRSEALALGDSVVVVDDGRVRQVGPVADVFSRPIDATVARIVGTETVVEARVDKLEEGLVVVSAGGRSIVGVDPGGVADHVFVCIRAEDVTLVPDDHATSSARNRLAARVVSVTREGPLVRVALDAGFRLVALVTRRSAEEMRLDEGQSVVAHVKAPAVRIVPRDGSRTD